ncbi:MAG: LysM peptidoglycan-binding domain-containing protein [Lachnospiraceae bacterium]|nr:LysM peptidoglycan-binding domain-containing protein [Lachnospiraceae bacterium]
MRQSSVIIHKGRREEKYEIYIEDYVMSFLKEETGTLDLSDFYFYGFRENDNRRYVVYGAGRDKRLAVFDRYSLLDELGCRLTQAGPVFLVKEKEGIYEVKGYDIFYQENREMQNYLIDRKRENVRDDRDGISDKTVSGKTGENVYADETTSTETGSRRTVQDTKSHKSPHSAISVQLGIILVALIAIVINSTNSYDKMTQLNQSAAEVFFAIENQEAQEPEETDEKRDEIVVVRDEVQEEVLKLVRLDSEEQVESAEQAETGKVSSEESAQSSTAAGEAVQEGDTQNTDSDEQEEVEALSRNVARYYEVEKGDTLYTISRKIYGDISYVQKICELNEITNPDQIRYGQKIILP